MKKLSDNSKVTARSYYFLLDWNETNDWEFIRDHFKKDKLSELTLDEYRILWLMRLRLNLMECSVITLSPGLNL
jgi:hypothetical protein